MYPLRGCKAPRLTHLFDHLIEFTLQLFFWTRFLTLATYLSIVFNANENYASNSISKGRDVFCNLILSLLVIVGRGQRYSFEASENSKTACKCWINYIVRSVWYFTLTEAYNSDNFVYICHLRYHGRSKRFSVNHNLGHLQLVRTDGPARPAQSLREFH